jgi:hypothetical protein
MIMNHDLMRLERSRADTGLFDDLPVTEVMNSSPLILEAREPPAEAARRASARQEGREYDPLLLTKAGKFVGIVAMRTLMEHLAGQIEDKRPTKIRS